MFPPFVDQRSRSTFDWTSLFARPLVTCDNPEDYPESYRSNSEKELTILKFVENFRRQYHYIYRDRKPLFLNPLNECGVTVMNLRPSLLGTVVYIVEICLHHRPADDVGIFPPVPMEFSLWVHCWPFKLWTARARSWTSSSPCSWKSIVLHNSCFSSSRRHFGRRRKFLLINVETASTMPICSARCWSAPDTTRTSSVATQPEKFATWIPLVYRIRMRKNARKFVELVEGRAIPLIRSV